MHTTRGMPLIWLTGCAGSGACVEIAALPDGGAAIRDGKDPEGPTLSFDGAEWSAFLEAVKAGSFDPGPRAAAGRHEG
jgi:Domain of unknown function (DUF397)